MDHLLSLGILCSSCDNPSSDMTSLPTSISEAGEADGAGVGDDFLLRLKNGILIANYWYNTALWLSEKSVC